MSKTIIITGTSGSGKSSTAKVLSETLPGTWALISQDDIRSMVKAGYASPVDGWNDNTKRQWDTSINICCDMVRRYRDADINCILDIFAPSNEFQTWQSAWEPRLKGVDYRLFVLRPNAETTVKRHIHRQGKMSLETIKQNHKLFEGWDNKTATIIDSTNQTLDETVALISQSIY